MVKLKSRISNVNVLNMKYLKAKKEKTSKTKDNKNDFIRQIYSKPTNCIKKTLKQAKVAEALTPPTTA